MFWGFGFVGFWVLGFRVSFSKAMIAAARAVPAPGRAVHAGSD